MAAVLRSKMLGNRFLLSDVAARGATGAENHKIMLCI